jgi:phage terminase large subunit-like protein
MPAKYPHVIKAEKYARDVVNGEIVACEWVIKACQRHLEDKKKVKNRGFKYRFDRKKAEKICKFSEFFPHVKGKWARKGEKIVLEPWQCFILCMIFGWVRKTNGLRRFRKVLIMVPRKNGKSLFAALIGLYMLVEDGEHGAEIYSGATSEKQAWEVFRPARLMALKAPYFRTHYGLQVNASNINVSDTESRFEPLIGKPGDGSSPSCAIHDEYHEHDTDEQVDTMETGMGAREQPLQFIITTAGSNLAGPCYALQKDAEKVLNGVYEDDAFFAIIYTKDEDDQWDSIETAQKANPNYGVSIDSDYLEQQLKQARHNPRKQAIYKTKHLNMWVASMNAYFNINKWLNNADKECRIEHFYGMPCTGGLDLASKIDIAARSLLFPPYGDRDYFVHFGKFYLPEATVYGDDTKQHYQAWDTEGWLTVTDGEIINFDVIKDDIVEIASLIQLENLGYDPHQATMLATSLGNEGIPVLEYRPTVLNFSEPMKQVDAYIRSGLLRHSGDPVMTWMMSNVVAKEDKKDNVYPNKERPEAKIDGAVSLIMAMGLYMAGYGIDNTSVYEKRGIITL